MISGTSLSELLASGGNTPDTEEAKAETQAEPAAVEVDPACEQKLVRAREGILNLLRTKRPRFVPAFELMTVRATPFRSASRRRSCARRFSATRPEC